MTKTPFDALWAPTFRKLERQGVMNASDREALSSVEIRPRTVAAGTYLFREGDHPVHCWIVYSGFICRQKLTSAGSRQIISLHFAGDFLGWPQIWLSSSDYNIQTLTAARIGSVSIDALRKMVRERPAIGEAMWVDTLVASAISEEWIVNIGRRNAKTRMAHFLCEFGFRSEIAGISTGGSFELPLTQEQIADATGMTSVHVNRTLQILSADGYVERDGRKLIVRDWHRLRDIADFRMGYLHDEIVPPNPASDFRSRRQN